MVRVGGGWDTLQGFLLKFDPCRVLQFTTLEQKILQFQKGVQSDSVSTPTSKSLHPPVMNPLSAISVSQKNTSTPSTQVTPSSVKSQNSPMITTHRGTKNTPVTSVRPKIQVMPRKGSPLLPEPQKKVAKKSSSPPHTSTARPETKGVQKNPSSPSNVGKSKSLHSTKAAPNSKSIVQCGSTNQKIQTPRSSPPTSLAHHITKSNGVSDLQAKSGPVKITSSCKPAITSSTKSEFSKRTEVIKQNCKSTPNQKTVPATLSSRDVKVSKKGDLPKNNLLERKPFVVSSRVPEKITGFPSQPLTKQPTIAVQSRTVSRNTTKPVQSSRNVTNKTASDKTTVSGRTPLSVVKLPQSAPRTQPVPKTKSSQSVSSTTKKDKVPTASDPVGTKLKLSRRAAPDSLKEKLVKNKEDYLTVSKRK